MELTSLLQDLSIYGEDTIQQSIGNTLFTKAGNFIVQENDTAGYATGNVPNYPGAFIAQGTTINQNVVNAVALGTNGAIVKTDNSTYVNAVAFNAGLAGEMRLVHTPNASDFTATLQAASGTIPLFPSRYSRRSIRPPCRDEGS